MFSQIYSIESSLIDSSLNVLSFNVNEQMQKIFDQPSKQGQRDAALSADLLQPSVEGLKR